MKYLWLTFLTLLVLGHSPQPGLAEPSELKPDSTEFARAQMVDWIDSETFVVGRWDGSLSVFRTQRAGEWTPVLLQTQATTGAGVELVVALDEKTILYSNGENELALWGRTGKGAFDAPLPIAYDVTYGVANSATQFNYLGDDLVVTGHANGFALVWKRDRQSLTLLRAVDLKSANPIPSPYPLKNIRGLAAWKGDLVLSGSEDGDIVAFSVTTGNERFRQRYSATAQRGINAISEIDGQLLVVNCSVGAADKNLWLYEVNDAGLTLRSSLNLVRDATRPQVFDFDGDLFETNGKVRFIASTEEGLMWRGVINAGVLAVDALATVAPNGGAALDVNDITGSIVAAAYDVMLFEGGN
ncbi:hypothetical protein [Mesorhizobium caraganae]|uniref:hypothetical protein n=1 Tax=Mesorhizobium caraganae TaxID=483206 RepID=UPI003ECCD205